MLGLRSRRLALQRSAGERIETERIIAIARSVLATTSTLTFPYISARFSHPRLVSTLLLIYCAHSLALLGALWFRTQTASRFAWLVHAGDLLWAMAICLFTNGTSSPFFLYFMFALLGGAFRWGMGEALLTAAITVTALASDAEILTLPWMSRVFGSHFDPHVFALRSAYIVIFAFMIGYLAETEKRRHGETLSLNRVSSEVRVDAGLKGTLQAVLQETLKLFGARELLLVAHDTEDGRANLWRVERLKNEPEAVFSWSHLEPEQRRNYDFEFPEPTAAGAWQKGKAKSAILLDREGRRIRSLKCSLPPEFLSIHTFRRVLSAGVSLAPDLTARLFLFEPQLGGNAEEQLRFFQQLTNQISPAVYNVYILRRLRSRVAEVERGRMARELHDGVVQSLHAIAFRLYALRTSTLVSSQECKQELIEIQELIQDATTSLRTLMHQLKPAEFDPRRLLDFLAGMVERYRYQTGIGAKFVCDVEKVSMRPQACKEIAGIVQEALANVQKHSHAENVLVRLSADEGKWILTVEDDGRGFAFSGRFSQADLEKTRSGPLVIKERVRSLGGELTIESRPGQGARLMITFPQMSMSSSA